jgi:hypothetical protein
MQSCDSHVGDVADAFDGELNVETCTNRSGNIVSNLARMADRVATLIAIILPFLGLVTAAFILWGWGFSWIDLGLLLGMYVATRLVPHLSKVNMFATIFFMQPERAERFARRVAGLRRGRMSRSW